MILAGYFPKLVVPRPDWLPDLRVGDACSVSNCLSKGPEGWVNQWIHNDLGWFNTVAEAWSVVPPEERGRFRLFAYRLAPSFFRYGQPQPVVIPDDVAPQPLPTTFQSLGFDTYSKSMDAMRGPECSPLSCNLMATEFRTNRHCLLDTFEEALAAASRFSIEQPEPGDYYVAEVMEEHRETADRPIGTAS